MIRPVPPVGTPEHVDFRGRTYAFDCIGGTGDPIYQYVKDSGERFHVIVVKTAGK